MVKAATRSSPTASRHRSSTRSVRKPHGVVELTVLRFGVSAASAGFTSPQRTCGLGTVWRPRYLSRAALRSGCMAARSGPRSQAVCMFTVNNVVDGERLRQGYPPPPPPQNMYVQHPNQKPQGGGAESCLMAWCALTPGSGLGAL